MAGTGAGRGLAETLFDETFLKKLEYLYIVSKKVFIGRLRADRRSRRLGSGQEFADFREYRPGDDLRHLDWSVYGRLDRLILRLFEEQADLMVHLAVDCSGSMKTPTAWKFDYARKVAAALAYIALANLDRVSVVPFATEPGQILSPRRGKGQVFRVFSHLEGLEARGETDFTGSMRKFVQEQPQRGLVVVISDFFAPGGYQEGVKLLRYNGHEVFVVQVCEATEARPGMTGDFRLVDAETGRERPAAVTAAVLRDYQAGFEAHGKALERFCLEQQTGCVRTLTEQPFEELILGVFRRGKFLH